MIIDNAVVLLSLDFEDFGWFKILSLVTPFQLIKFRVFRVNPQSNVIIGHLAKALASPQTLKISEGSL